MADKVLTSRLHFLQQAALSQSTRRAYRSGTQRYKAFCTQYAITPFPASEETLCYFVAYLSHQVQHATARLYLAAVRAEQIERGWEDPLKSTLHLASLLRGLQKTAKHRVRKPIMPPLFHKLLCAVLSNGNWCKHDRFLYAAAISIAYFGCLRAGEMSYPSSHSYHADRHLTIKDISLGKDCLEICIKHSKTDQTSKGSTVKLSKALALTLSSVNSYTTDSMLAGQMHSSDSKMAPCSPGQSYRGCYDTHLAPSRAIWYPQPTHRLSNSSS